ncbi:MAG: Hsp20/alpha crystallin family protein [Acidimicrobiia bacterium]|nr:Hsp20/alpha crystallin family protein [Acidimicrobiia bacterium]NNF64485.1 Hsp20/alpha crystallin family protein [Acidimicrobiia bacterium]
MDRLFDRFFADSWFTAQPGVGSLSEWLPSLDVIDKDRSVTIRVELPGMMTEDIDVATDGRYLTVSGKREETSEDRGDDHYHCERCFGSFRRTIELPESAELDALDAELADGVLTVKVPKLESAKPKKVAIKSPREAEARELVGAS